MQPQTTRRRWTAYAGLAAAALFAGTLSAIPGAGPAAAATAALQLTNPLLVFDQGTASVTLTSDQASASYQVSDEAGVIVATGTVAVSGGAGAINLNALGPGYYKLSVTAGSGTTATTVPTTFAVLGAFAQGASRQDQRFGMDMHFGHQPNDPTLFALLGRLGFTYTRTDQSWNPVEVTPGTYTWSNYVTDKDVPVAKQNGITTLLISAYNNKNYDGGVTPYTQAGWDAYGRYTNGIFEHFGQFTKDIEIYNEFNGGFDTATACNHTLSDKVRCYLGLLKAAHQSVKVDGGHADANLIGPVAAGIDQPWITGLLDGGALSYIDTFSFHTYAGSNPETAYANVPWLKQQIRNHNGGKDMPLWITETGQTVMTGLATEADQADFAIRLPVLAFASGIDKYFWYDLLNDGSDPTNKEHNFGQLKQPTTGVVAQAPKPSLVTQATILRQIGGMALAGSDGLAAPAYSYRFGSGSNTTRVMWATTPTTVQVSATGPVTVTDEYGRVSTYTPVNGSVPLDLDKHPIFVRGATSSAAIRAVKAVVHPAVTLSVPQTSNTAETIPATITSTTPTARNGTVAGKPFTLRANADGTATATVQVPTTSQTGSRALIANVGLGPRPTTRLTAETSVRPATEVTTTPAIASTNPQHNQLKVTITNNRRAASVPVSSVYWQLNDGTAYLGRGTVAAVPDIPAGQSATITIDVPAVPAWEKRWFFDRVTTGDGAQVTSQGWTGWNPIEPAGSSNVPPINLGTQVARTYPGGYGGATDLSGTLKPSYTSDALVLTADVTDNMQYQPNSDPSLMWSADSIQFAVTPHLPGLSNQRVELGAALLPTGPAVYTWSPPPGQSTGPTTGAKTAVTRSGTVTHYEITVPWTSLGLPGAPADGFGLSVLINDNDGTARNWAAWGDGIASTKSAMLLRPVQLVTN
ncbi:hypothetical protein JOF29_001617 [Kribbella aluminosa]|uniref:Uncharacterized protein n=1 Tax=Kribbella aluminosa TaxID=416017 RepID=A0ABS4UFW4_9ACTN|nr:hypothetical protein [Kribbella aluminosa]MBP2350534.1 hypothetical protein [Kribbella aluminosa]